MNTTTRRYPRTLSEAFKDERAHCIEGPDRGANELAGAIVGFIAALGAAVLIFHKVAEVLK